MKINRYNNISSKIFLIKILDHKLLKTMLDYANQK